VIERVQELWREVGEKKKKWKKKEGLLMLTRDEDE
jgi:hypothetical protein